LAIEASPAEVAQILGIRSELERFFNSRDGFGEIVKLNWTDGIRIHFSNGDVAHVRPSGNADELRIYAVADTQTRADGIACIGVSEPEGILRQLEKVVNQ
jgi:phosphomannomutase